MMSGGSSGGGGANRAEADRWLATSEKLLASGDLHGAKTFAIRACEADPTRTEAADYILAVSDTLLAGESRVGNTNLPDWYAVLRLVRLAHNPELVATQYRRLALLLNPAVNRLPFADQAFRLVADAWYVLSDSSRKALYDRELQLSQLGQLGPLGFQPYNQLQQQPYQQYHQIHQPQQLATQQNHQEIQQPQQFQWQPLKQNQAQPERSSKFPGEEERPNLNNATESTRQVRPSVSTQPSWAFEPAQPNRRVEPARPYRTSEPVHYVARPAQSAEPGHSTPNTEPVHASEPEPSAESSVPSFWTACPYCFTLFEYPKVYEECTLRCQNCRRAFQAVTIQSPPVTGKNATFCSWSYFPLGYSGNAKPIGWSPISPMFPCPMEGSEQHQNDDTGNNSGAPRFYYDDDDVYVEISEHSEDDENDGDWRQSEIRQKKKAKYGQGKASTAKNNNKNQSENVWQDGQSSSGGASGSIVQESVIVGSSSGVTKVVGNTGRKKTGTGAKNLGKLDLNVEFSNEVEETAVARGRSQGSGLGSRVEDTIEGNGFFEGLDEFLSSLPILSVVPDDKVKAT